MPACPPYDDGFWGEFQGKEASEQHIRELCVGMVSGECPLSCPAPPLELQPLPPPAPSLPSPHPHAASPSTTFQPSHAPGWPTARGPRGLHWRGPPPRRVHRGAWCTGDVLNVCSMKWSQGSNNRALSALTDQVDIFWPLRFMSSLRSSRAVIHSLGHRGLDSTYHVPKAVKALFNQ